MKSFEEYVAEIPGLFAQLQRAERRPIMAKGLEDISAIYIFFEDGKAEHVGRTRRLKSRVRGHLAKNHFSASYVFKRTRKAMGMEQASYTTKDSRGSLMKAEHPFRAAFEREHQTLRGMEMSFLEIEDQISQYLLELYTAMQLGTCIKEFSTH